MNKFAIVYGWRNSKTGQVYVGIHQTDETDDRYISSSTNPYFQQAWSRGECVREILFEGSYEDCINIEYAILSKYDAKNNKMFYNNSNGGGALLNKSYEPCEELMQLVQDWIVGNRKPNQKKSQGIYNKEKMNLLVDNIKSGFFAPEEYSVELLYTLDKNQVRMEALNEKHVNDLCESFKDPAEARKYLTPIIVMIDEDGTLIKLLDGNHRVNAAYRMKWKTMPVVFVSEAEFGGNVKNLEYFGNRMNHQPYIALGNSTDDLIKQLLDLASLHPSMEMDSDDFILMAKLNFGGKDGNWRDNQITKQCGSLAEKDREYKLKQGTNFITYTPYQLEKYKKEYQRKNRKIAVITQGVDSICNAGYGGIVRTMTKSKTNKGVIIVHCPKYAQYQNKMNYIAEFNEMCEALKETLQIKLVFLDAFNEGFENSGL
jgi:hypothetical protein